MSKPTLLIVIPTFGAFDYAATAVRTALDHTTTADPHVYLVDDASPDRDGWDEFVASLDETRLSFHRFEENGGLTRSWNRGLHFAVCGGFDYCAVANSDLLFAPGWDRAILRTLEHHALAGPLTNAPGTSQEQYVGKYSKAYDREAGDDWRNIVAVQKELDGRSPASSPATLNGFCMVAKTGTWDLHRYSPGCVFKPRNDASSKGVANPTPLMTLNEYELQGRWLHKGLVPAIALGSYVFHYRAVSRGDAYRRGDWFRKKGAAK